MAVSIMVLSGFVVFGLLIWYFSEGRKTASIKHIGIKGTGVIIENNEFRSGKQNSDQLGGNINSPTVRFTIENGTEVIGKPVSGFISQHEVQVPSYINIIYDPNEPSRFIIDPD